MGRRIRGKGIETDGLHAVFLSKTNSLTNHLRANSFALTIGTHGKDMNHSHLIVIDLLRPFYRMIILP